MYKTLNEANNLKDFSNEEFMISFLENYIEQNSDKEEVIPITDRIITHKIMINKNIHLDNDIHLNEQVINFLEDRIYNKNNKILLSTSGEIDGSEILKTIDINRNKKSRDKIIKRIKDDVIKTKYIGECLGIYGALYEKGLFGIKMNHKKALSFYKLSTKYKYSIATYRLARCFEYGIGAEIDLEKATFFYRVGYKLGYFRSIHKYSLILLNGNTFVERDISLGTHLLKLTVLLSPKFYNQAFYDLGMIYNTIDPNIIPDGKYAFRIFLEGAQRNCKNCQYKLAEEYESGKNVTKNIYLAFEWYKKSADNGLPDAQLKIAYILLKSEIHKNKQMKDISFHDIKILDEYSTINLNIYFDREFNILIEAYKMIEKSASCGNISGMITLAELLSLGIGTKKNLLLSLWWYKIVEIYGIESVTKNIKQLESKINELKHNDSRSICGLFSCGFY